VADIKERHAKGQPVLIGTRSVEKSEKLSRMLKKEGIPHEVLNAKYHEKEAEIIAKLANVVLSQWPQTWQDEALTLFLVKVLQSWADCMSLVVNGMRLEE